MSLPPDDPHLLAIGELRRLLNEMREEMRDRLADILEALRDDRAHTEQHPNQD